MSKSANPKAIPPDSILSNREVDILLSYWRAKREDDLKHGRSIAIKKYIMLQVMLNTGVRLSEVANIKVQDIHLGREPYIRIVGKGDKHRYVYLGKPFIKALKPYSIIEDLRDYLEWHKNYYEGKTDYLIPNKTYGKMSKTNIGQAWRTCMKQAGLKVKRPHSSRHWYASTFMKRKKDLLALQRQLGHSDISTTSRYLHMSGEEISKLMMEE